ncbi:MAG TPA: MerR family transcriptional regulator [Kiloniellaceae bacterium]|nr:MerR family transcriptional regulator [Kiloniellaceae bacterium]
MATTRAAGKSATAFRTISEVSEELEVPQHVLRFWETKFTLLKPLKRAGGRRYYRPEDIELLRRIRSLLYKDGYTIKGAQKLLREGRGRAAEKASEDASEESQAAATAASAAVQADGIDRSALQEILQELEGLRDYVARAVP